MSVGRIVAHVMANTANFTAGMRKGRKELETFGSRAAKTSASIAKFTVAATAAGGAMVAALVRQGMQAVDTQAKLARSMGGTIGGLEGLQRAAKDAGVDVSALNSSAQRLQLSLGEARLGTGRAAEALKDLNLQAGDLARLDVDERMASIADAMKDARMTGDQMSETLSRLGIRNREMVLLMGQGGEAIRDATAEMRGYGLAVSAMDSAMIENLNDQLDRSKDVMRGITTQLAVHAAPALDAVVGLFSDASKETNGFGEQSEKAVEIVLKGAGHISNAFQGWRLIFKGVQVAYQAMITLWLKGFGQAVGAVDDMVNAAIKSANWLATQANRLLGDGTIPLMAERQASEVTWLLNAMAEDSAIALEKLRGEFADMANEEMPYDKLWQSYQNSLQKREGLAAEYEEKERQRIADLVRAEIDARNKAAAERARIFAEQAAREAAAERDRLLGNLQSLEAFLRSEEEALQFAHDRRLEQLEELAESDLQIAADLHEMRERLEEDHLERLNALRQEANEEHVRLQKVSMHAIGSIIGDGMSAITRVVDRESRAAFEVNKLAGMSNAAISTIVAVQKWGELGPKGIPGAIAAAITGAANVAAIASQTFGGGAARTATPAQATQTVRREITIRGEGTNAREFVRSIIPELNEALGDGAIIRAGE